MSLRLGFIGCGAIVTRFLLPAARTAGWRPSLVVDPNLDRVRKVAKRFGIKHLAPTLDDADTSAIDAAIVAVPHSLHGSVTVELLKRGVHVFVEKPMAISVADCERMIAASESSGAALVVGQMYRYSTMTQWVAALVHSGVLGRIRTVDVRVGDPFGWPVASPARWNKALSGGGALIDTGVHFLDLLLWWLGDFEPSRYRDDSYGGVEADCLLEFSLPGGGTGVAEFSCTRKLRKSIVIEGEHGTLECELNGGRVLRAEGAARGFAHDGIGLDDLPLQPWDAFFPIELGEFMSTVSDGAPSRTPGSEGIRSIRLIEDCYRRRELWDLPWVSGSPKAKITAEEEPVVEA